MLRRLFTILGILLLVWSPVFAQSAREVAAKTFPSVVMLIMEDANGQPSSQGSGFFVGENLIATNLHVVEGSSTGYAKLIGKRQRYDIRGHVGIDKRRDLILLRLSGGAAPALPIGTDDEVAVGDEVFAIGNPQGLEGTFSQGIVSGIRAVGQDSLLQITAPISPGSSGGPVVDAAGKVIGIAVATIRSGQNLNFAIPVSYLSSLLSETHPVAPLPGKRASSQGASILSRFGGKNIAGVQGTHLVWDTTIFGIGDFSFTLQNRLRNPVKNVYVLVIFYARDGSPLDVVSVVYRRVIPPRLGKRASGKVSPTIKRLTTASAWRSGEKHIGFPSAEAPSTRVEIRVLDFRIVDD